MNLEFFPIIIVFLLNFIFYYSHEKIASFLNIYDYPDEIRKKHSKPIPLLGGIYLIFNILIIYIINFSIIL